MSINFRISIGDRKQYSLFVCQNGEKYEIIAKPLNKGCGTLFRIVGLPTYLNTNHGFYLGLKYYLQAAIDDSGNYRYLQLNSDDTYTATTTSSENSMGFVFYDTAYWNDHIKLSVGGKCCSGALRFLNYCPKICSKHCEKVDPHTAIFRNDDMCEKLMIYTTTECLNTENCTTCGPAACPLNTTCTAGNCVNSNSLVSGANTTGFSLRMLENECDACPLVITYDFVSKGKCCNSKDSSKDVKLRMRFVPANTLSANSEDPCNFSLQLFYADGTLEVGKISPIYVIQNNAKKYLSNPVIGEDYKGIYTEYCLETTSGCRSFAFKPTKTGNWLTFAFDQCNFQYLLIPFCNDENWKTEKGHTQVQGQNKGQTKGKGKDQTKLQSQDKDQKNKSKDIQLPEVKAHRFTFPVTLPADFQGEEVDVMVNGQKIRASVPKNSFSKPHPQEETKDQEGKEEKGKLKYGFITESSSPEMIEEQCEDCADSLNSDDLDGNDNENVVYESSSESPSRSHSQENIQESSSRSHSQENIQESSSDSNSNRDSNCTSDSDCPFESDNDCCPQEKESRYRFGFWSNISKAGTSVVPSNGSSSTTSPLIPLQPTPTPITPTPVTPLQPPTNNNNNNTTWTWWTVLWIFGGIIVLLFIAYLIYSFTRPTPTTTEAILFAPKVSTPQVLMTPCERQGCPPQMVQQVPQLLNQNCPPQVNQPQKVMCPVPASPCQPKPSCPLQTKIITPTCPLPKKSDGCPPGTTAVTFKQKTDGTFERI